MSKDSNYLDLNKITNIFLKEKIKLLTIVICFFAFGLFFSLSIPNKYTSEIVLSSTQADDNNLQSQFSRLSGLASLGGINISQNNNDRSAEAIEIIKSLGFFSEIIADERFFLDLIAAADWDSASRRITYDKKYYDSGNEKWVYDGEFSTNSKPSIQFAHRKFLSDNLSITRDSTTGFIKISLTHFSPEVAQDTLSKIIFYINEKIRNEDIEKANKSINFLQQEIEGTLLTDVRAGLSNLIQSETEKKMIANATPEYVFKTLSGPNIPEVKSSPQRLLIVIFSTILGFMIGVFVIFFRNYLNEYRAL
jgi:LPS O-antigen subunit length determinant protein (WzzB/FepE family)